MPPPKVSVVPPSKEKRIMVCMLVLKGDPPMSVAAACRTAGISRSTFMKGEWLAKFEEGGINALLTDGHNGNSNAAVGKSIKKKIVSLKRKRASASFIEAKLQQELDNDKIDRSGPKRRKKAPCTDTILAVWKANGGKHGIRTLVVIKEPWTARYREYFAKKWLKQNPRVILFSDAKKFCQWLMRGVAGMSEAYHKDDDPNVARDKEMTDQEYLAWVAKYGKALPKEKAKGLMKVMVYGALGYNCKSKLYILEEGQTLTMNLYDKIFKSTFKPMRKTPPGGGPALRADQDMLMVQDNDPKHQAWMEQPATKTFLKRNRIKMVTAPQLAEDGSTDIHQNVRGPRAQKPRVPSFPPYSNDINWVIEKAWRELGYRCMDRWRAGEIKTRKDHIKVVKEEWDQLEFHEVKRNGRVWKGINWYVDNWNEKVLKEVIKQKGWDTKYM